MLNWMEWQWQDAVRVFVGGDSGEVMVVVRWSVNYVMSSGWLVVVENTRREGRG